eukprot:GHVU01036036.1.p2 GENE.GHVU01036036.1~~GHVU01036036.1.p2  ORF type:complete len:222 (+),score=33.78 GHVU01036036.1:779-1444(+)
MDGWMDSFIIHHSISSPPSSPQAAVARVRPTSEESTTTDFAAVAAAASDEGILNPEPHMHAHASAAAPTAAVAALLGGDPGTAVGSSPATAHRFENESRHLSALLASIGSSSASVAASNGTDAEGCCRPSSPLLGAAANTRRRQRGAASVSIAPLPVHPVCVSTPAAAWKGIIPGWVPSIHPSILSLFIHSFTHLQQRIYSPSSVVVAATLSHDGFLPIGY